MLRIRNLASARPALAVGIPPLWTASASMTAISAGAAMRRATVATRPPNQCGAWGRPVISSDARPCARSACSSPDFNASSSHSDSLNRRIAAAGLRRKRESKELSVINAVTAEVIRLFNLSHSIFYLCF